MTKNAPSPIPAPIPSPIPGPTSSLSCLALAALAFGGLAGSAAVALGALAAHALADPASGLAETASRYGLIHALAMTGGALALDRLPGGWARRLAILALGLFAVGIICFSGGLAALAWDINTGSAPIGGSALIVAWLFLALAAVAAAIGRHSE